MTWVAPSPRGLSKSGNLRDAESSSVVWSNRGPPSSTREPPQRFFFRAGKLGEPRMKKPQRHEGNPTCPSSPLSLSFSLLKNPYHFSELAHLTTSNPIFNQPFCKLIASEPWSQVHSNPAAKKCHSPAAASVSCAPPTGASHKARDSPRTVGLIYIYPI